jgi:hypothetical protein
MTNADKIRGMTDEQLAEWLADIIDCWHCPRYTRCTEVKGCANALKAWLQQEHVESGDSND